VIVADSGHNTRTVDTSNTTTFRGRSPAAAVSADVNDVSGGDANLERSSVYQASAVGVITQKSRAGISDGFGRTNVAPKDPVLTVPKQPLRSANNPAPDCLCEPCHWDPVPPIHGHRAHLPKRPRVFDLSGHRSLAGATPRSPDRRLFGRTGEAAVTVGDTERTHRLSQSRPRLMRATSSTQELAERWDGTHAATGHPRRPGPQTLHQRALGGSRPVRTSLSQ
jgi:hypothetical protein